MAITKKTTAKAAKKAAPKKKPCFATPKTEKALQESLAGVPHFVEALCGTMVSALHAYINYASKGKMSVAPNPTLKMAPSPDGNIQFRLKCTINDTYPVTLEYTMTPGAETAGHGTLNFCCQDTYPFNLAGIRKLIRQINELETA